MQSAILNLQFAIFEYAIYNSPCGDKFRISLADLWDGEDIAPCPSCTLRIMIIYDEEDLPPLPEGYGETDDEEEDGDYDDDSKDEEKKEIETNVEKNDGSISDVVVSKEDKSLVDGVNDLSI